MVQSWDLPGTSPQLLGGCPSHRKCPPPNCPSVCNSQTDSHHSHLPSPLECMYVSKHQVFIYFWKKFIGAAITVSMTAAHCCTVQCYILWQWGDDWCSDTSCLCRHISLVSICHVKTKTKTYSPSWLLINHFVENTMNLIIAGHHWWISLFAKWVWGGHPTDGKSGDSFERRCAATYWPNWGIMDAKKTTITNLKQSN